MYKLKTTGSPPQEFPLKTGAYRIGSAWDSEMVIQDDSVAHYHCEVVVTPTMVTVRDLSPNHETYINGERVENARLELGQTLRLGEVSLVMEHDASDGMGAGPGAGPQGGRKTAAKKKRTKLAESIGFPLLLLLALAGIAVFLYTYRPVGGKPAATPENPGNPSPVEEPKESTPSHEPNLDSSASVGPEKSADPQAKEALELLKQPFDPNQTNRTPEMDLKVAESHIRNGAADRAEPFLQRALRNQQKTLGADDPEVTKTLTQLGRVYRQTKRYPKAEPLLEKALANVEKKNGPDNAETASAANELGEMRLASGQYERAAPLLERALNVREKLLKPDDPSVGASLNNLAALKSAQGDPTNSAKLLQRALKIFETNFSPNHPTVAKTLNNLGQLQLRMGELGNAETTLQSALQRKEAIAAPDDPQLNDSLTSLAAVHAAKGDHAKAQQLQERALAISEKAFGPDHPDTVRSVEALAAMHQKSGDFAKAASLLERAAKTSEKTLGPTHPQTALSLGKLADSRLCQNSEPRAREIAAQALQAQFRAFADVVWYGSEKHRLACRDRLNPYSLAAFLQTGPEIASAVLQYKGVILDALLEDGRIAHAGRKEDVRFLVSDLQETKDELAQLLFEIPNDLSAKDLERRQSERTGLTTHLEKLEGGLGQHVPGLGRPRKAIIASISEVKKSVAPDVMIVELVRYARCRGNDQWEPNYGAVVFGESMEPVWIPLGNADEIDRHIQRYQTELLGSSTGASVDPANATKILQALHQQLWAPLEKSFSQGAKRIVISPDGALNLVSFATLLSSDDVFVGQKYSIRYVSSARDLLEPKKAPSTGQMFIVGSPDFWARSAATNENASSSPPIQISELDRRDLQAVQLPRLTGAEQESGLLEFLVKRWKWPVQSVFGEKAGEVQFAAADSPRIVHLATSGFFLPRSASETGTEELRSGPGVELFSRWQPASADESGLMPEATRLFAGPMVLRNPIHRTGIALAGAQTTFLSWKEGATVPAENDGVVTAADIACMNLQGTALIVLSASATGVNSPRSGEAVLALRRAFVQAGAENLLLPLRTVSEDETTPILMDFYARFDATADAAQSFAEVQRDWLVRLRAERGLAASVRLAGALVLNSLGPVR